MIKRETDIGTDIYIHPSLTTEDKSEKVRVKEAGCSQYPKIAIEHWLQEKCDWKGTQATRMTASLNIYMEWTEVQVKPLLDQTQG